MARRRRPPQAPSSRGALSAAGRASSAAGKQGKSAAAYARRNERARALGYRNYYDYRTHNHGRIAPGQPRPAGEARQRLRGHRGAADLERAIGPGSLVIVDGWERDAVTGTYLWVELRHVNARGQDTVFKMRKKDLTRAGLRRFVEALADAGATFSVGGSMDVRRLAEDFPDVVEGDDLRGPSIGGSE